ncbi:filamentous hemagglutinin N-terminal domain-containing protein [Sphingomonas sp. Y38-1Y]|uniref:two-partner secretion domain-containing protein n=1 Tax=Sphingomonas sp. Y38-1Y TaxID=3078265 RepID=UPI0028EC6203|nr:filamentous hemagglutinin N-terminal domain-containing protein [Sphingomonas sp. Y38-1Y]
MDITTGRKGLRAALILSSALVPAAAAAQSLPGPAQVVGASVSPGGTAPVIGNPTATSLQVDLKASATVINWNGFNVPAETAARFSDTRATPGSPISVLNRDVSGSASPSAIRGSMSSDTNVAIWVYNPAGIIVGEGAAINTGSLVLTTLDPGAAAFLIGQNGGAYRLTADAASTAAVRIESGASINLGTGNRGLVLVAPAIDSAGSLDAGGQDAAFVTATDVSLAYVPGSPINVTINRGTSVGGAAQIVRGSVDGRSVAFAMATQADVVDSLLQVDGQVSAVAGPRGVVIVAGRSPVAVDGVTVAAGADAGSVAVSTAGSLTSGGDVVVRANDNITGAATMTAVRDAIIAGQGDAALSGAIAAGREVTVTAEGAASVTGAVDAGRNYAVRGQGVTLGGADVLQAADGALTIEVRGGTLTGAAGTTLQANADGVGSEGLSLITGGTSGGDIAAGGVALIAGANRESDVLIRTRTADNAVTLGAVEARVLNGAVGTAVAAQGLTRTGALTLGDVTLTGGLTLDAAAVTTGAVRSDGDVLLTSPGAIMTGAIDAGGRVAVAGAGLETTTGVLTAWTGDVSVERGGSVTLGGADAATTLAVGAAVRPETLTITGPASAGGNVLLRATGAIATAALTGASVAVTSGTGGITTGDALARSGALTLTAPGTIVAGALSGETVDVVSSSASVTTGVVTARSGAATLTAATSLSVAGVNGASAALTSGDDLSLTGATQVTGDFAATSGGALDLAGRVASSGGSVALTATGALTVNGSVVAATAASITGGSVTLGSSAATTIEAPRAIAITATGGDIVAGAGTRIAGDLGGTVELATRGTVGGDIRLDAASVIDGSTVIVRSRDAANRVVLGAVNAVNLQGAVGGEAAATGIVRLSPIVTGRVAVRGQILLDGFGLTTGDLVSGGNVTLRSVGDVQVGAITANGAIALTGTGATRIASIGGESDLTSLTLDRDGALDVTGGIAVAGDIAIGGTVAPASVTIGGGVDAGGSVAITSVGDIGLADLSGASAALISRNGGFRADRIDVSGAASVRAAGDATVADLAAASAGLTSDAGRISLSGGQVTGALAIEAGRDVALSGNVTAGTLTARGAGIALAAGTRIDSTAADLTARTVAITAGSGAALSASGGPLALRSGGAGGIAFATDTSITTGGTLALFAAPGAPITLGRVDAARLVQLSAIDGAVADASGAVRFDAPVTLGDVTLAEALSLTVDGADLRAGSIAAQGIALTTIGGDIRTGNVDAGSGALALNAGGALAIGNAAGSSIDAAASGEIRGGIWSGVGAVDVTGATVALTSLRSSSGRIGARATGGDPAAGAALAIGSVATPDTIVLRAEAGSAEIGFASGNAGVDTLAAGRLGIGTLNGARLSTIGGSVSLREVTGRSLLADARVGDLSILGAATLSGGAVLRSGGVLRAGTLTLGADGLDADAVGAVTIARLASVGAVRVEGASLSIDTASGDGAATLIAGAGDASSGTLDFAGETQVRAAGSVGVRTIQAASLDIQAGGSVLARGLTTGGSLAVRAGGDVRNALTVAAGGDAQVTAGGAIDLASVTAGSTLALTGGSVRVAGPARAAGNAAIAAQAGDIVLDTLSAGAAATLTASGAVGADRIDAASLELTAGGEAAVDAIGITGDATISGLGGVRVSSSEVGGALEASSPTSVTLGTTRAGSVTVRAGGLATLGETRARSGDIDVAGASITVGAIDAARDVLLASARGDLPAGAGSLQAGAIVAGRDVSASGATVRIASVRAGRDLSAAADTLTVSGASSAAGAATLRGGSVTTAGLTAGGAMRIEGTQIATGALGAGSTIDVVATRGVTIDSAVAGGAMRIAGAGVTTGALRAASLDLSSNGDAAIRSAEITDAASVRVSGNLTTRRVGTGGALRLEGAGVTTGALGAATTLDIVTPGVATIEAASAGGNLRIGAGALTTGGLRAGGTLDAAASGNAAIGSIDVVGATTVTGLGVQIGSVTSGALSVTAGRDLTLGATRASGAATLQASGLATLGSFAAPSLTLTAADAELGGTVAATTVTLVNRLAGSAVLRVGDGTGAGGFRLSNAEVGRIETATLTLDGGATGSIELGTLAFDADAGRARVNLWAGGRVDVTGAVSGSGAGRVFFIGGRPIATGIDYADVIRVAATADGGGRLLFDNAAVELNADRIGVGQAAGFLDRVDFTGGGLSADEVASRFVSNPGSSLYNALVGGSPYADGAATLVSAGRMTVRYSGYALFQNTGGQGLNTGVTLNAPAGSAALVLDAARGGASNGFALFGSINGVTGISAAILGAQTIETSGINLPASRVNGCIIGSAAGCLTTVIAQAPLNVFDSSRLNVFAASDDFALPFDPVVGSNNEALFAGAFANDPGAIVPECDQVEPGRCAAPGEQP